MLIGLVAYSTRKIKLGVFEHILRVVRMEFIKGRAYIIRVMRE